jgi:hypothetical protein
VTASEIPEIKSVRALLDGSVLARHLCVRDAEIAAAASAKGEGQPRERMVVRALSVRDLQARLGIVK